MGPPKVTSLTPSTGPLTATSLSVFGENLLTTTSVAFGDAGVAAEVVIASNTTLTVVTPEHAPLEPGIDGVSRRGVADQCWGVRGLALGAHLQMASAPC
ncbi:IPT/TIG domain-containing protein, partial [Streptomyces sp. NPDC102462]|uniref:IPT/TIG domain-containing protein n=1 Tax=Streptomyces sp. NPDC102462 TaxID=3366178 RepID=UPI00382B46F5